MSTLATEATANSKAATDTTTAATATSVINPNTTTAAAIEQNLRKYIQDTVPSENSTLVEYRVPYSGTHGKYPAELYFSGIKPRAQLNLLTIFRKIQKADDEHIQINKNLRNTYQVLIKTEQVKFAFETYVSKALGYLASTMDHLTRHPPDAAESMLTSYKMDMACKAQYAAGTGISNVVTASASSATNTSTDSSISAVKFK